jgi:hypothetical protein
MLRMRKANSKLFLSPQSGTFVLSGSKIPLNLHIVSYLGHWQCGAVSATLSELRRPIADQ